MDRVGVLDHSHTHGSVSSNNNDGLDIADSIGRIVIAHHCIILTGEGHDLSGYHYSFHSKVYHHGFGRPQCRTYGKALPIHAV
tara:strand:- start:547 stop:795 length:249 start_codon:yes stop_codon:yes gene_type:complete